MYDIVNSQERVQYTFRDIYNMGLNNYLWISWIPVFILFLILAKSKNDLLYFAGIVTFFSIVGVININTLAAFVLAAIFGVVFKRLYTGIRRSKASAIKNKDNGIDSL